VKFNQDNMIVNQIRVNNDAHSTRMASTVSVSLKIASDELIDLHNLQLVNRHFFVPSGE